MSKYIIIINTFKQLNNSCCLAKHGFELSGTTWFWYGCCCWYCCGWLSSLFPLKWLATAPTAADPTPKPIPVPKPLATAPPRTCPVANYINKILGVCNTIFGWVVAFVDGVCVFVAVCTGTDVDDFLFELLYCKMKKLIL